MANIIIKPRTNHRSAVQQAASAKESSSPSTPSWGADVPPILQRVYHLRGVYSPAEVDPALSNLLPPTALKGLDQAVALLSQAVIDKKNIVIVGDFDADGATSCALAVSALNAFGHQDVSFLVPNRFEYGYGLTPEIVALAARRKPDLIVTVDNGISSIEGVASAKRLGMQVVITDHHLPADVLPEADAIVNPNQRGCEFGSKSLAGVGVIFYVLSALRSRLEKLNWFAEKNIKPPSMASYLDLVALGTVADVVPLDKNNRILVEQGLRRIRAGQTRPGIQALIRIAGRQAERLTSSDFGFALAPRLNAAGRLDDMSMGIACLLTKDEQLASDIAQELDAINRERREIERGMHQQAKTMLEHWQDTQSSAQGMPHGLCLFDESWHQGVVGILASRIKEQCHRPVICFAKDEVAGQLKGSARSIDGFHIRDALDAVAANNPGLVSKFGGHAMAAGLSLPQENFTDFSRAFDQEVRRQLDASALQAILLSDGELAAEELTLSTAQILRYAGPWGQHFPEAVFHGVFELCSQRLVGEAHLKCQLRHMQSDQLIDAIAFNIDVQYWPNTSVKQVRIAYKLEENIFRGMVNLQLLIEHIEPYSASDQVKSKQLSRHTENANKVPDSLLTEGENNV